MIVIVLIFLVMWEGNMNSKRLNFEYDYPCVTPDEKILREFVEKKLISEYGGIFTNYKMEFGSRDVLSESEGLIMLYYLYIKDEAGYRMHYEFVMDKMMLKNNLVSWRVGEDYQYSSSASIDDLRIIRALLIGYSVFGNREYFNLAKRIIASVKKYECRNGFLVDYYDGYTKSGTITLSYIDLYTINLISNYELSFKSIYENSKWVLENGKIEGTPFFRNRYNLRTKQYSSEYKVDMLQNAIVIEHLAEDNIFYMDFIKFIKNEIEKKGAVYSEYYIKDLKPASRIESTAIYATLARVALYYRDIDLYNMLINRMLKLQCKNRLSPIYGAFGNESNLYVHSFDNLNALLALRMGGCYIVKEDNN
ncbi:MAG: glycoside hydrolase [Caloramator sp.]|nr:glycoside hydrolase [Caloramator sp.]